MNIYDYIVIGAVALALAAAVVCMIKKARQRRLLGLSVQRIVRRLRLRTR